MNGYAQGFNISGEEIAVFVSVARKRGFGDFPAAVKAGKAMADTAPPRRAGTNAGFPEIS